MPILADPRYLRHINAAIDHIVQHPDRYRLTTRQQPDAAHQPCFEAWHGLPFGHGTEHYELTVQLPVVPLTGVVEPLGWEP